MRLSWEGEAEDAAAAARTGSELETLRGQAEGEPIRIGNEFAEVRVTKVSTRNGVRLLVESPKSGQWVTLDPLELEAPENLQWLCDALLTIVCELHKGEHRTSTVLAIFECEDRYQERLSWLKRGAP